MGAKPTVAFRIEADTKAKWQDAVEESDEYSNLTHLITKAVNRELSGAYDVTDVTDVPESSGVDAEVADTVESLQERLDGLEGAVRDATDAVHASSGIDEQLPIDVFEGLPVGEENAVTAERLSELVGRKAASTRFALENLRRSTSTVNKVRPMNPDDEQGEPETVESEHGDAVIDPEEAGYESGVIEEPLWFKSEGA